MNRNNGAVDSDAAAGFAAAFGAQLRSFGGCFDLADLDVGHLVGHIRGLAKCG